MPPQKKRLKPDIADFSCLAPGCASTVEDNQYLEGQGDCQGDLISRLILGIFRVTIWVIGVINLLTKSP